MQEDYVKYIARRLLIQVEALNKSNPSVSSSKGYVHRDIKPENILIDGNYRPFLSDFGGAIQISHASSETASGTTSGY